MAQHPPGPRGEPVFGDSRRYARDPFGFASALEEAYGDLARFEMGPIDTYLLCDPAEIERVLVSEADRFRKPDFQDDALGRLLGDGLLLSEGETWESQRELANPAFDMSRLAGMADRITGHAEAMVEDWEAGDVVDIEIEMTDVTLRVIADLMLGVDLDADRIETVREALDPIGRRFEPDPLRYAAPEWVPMPGDAEYESAVSTLDGVVEDVIAERRGTEGDEDGPMDLLSILLRARDRGAQSADQLRDEVTTILLAGHDTTALTLTYAWFLLSEHPDAAAEARAEVESVVGEDSIGMEHVREFEYVEWVVREAMRLYPPVFSIFRTPTESVELAGYQVEEDATIMLSQWAMHRSERFWDAPGEFDPERWRPERRRERPRFAYFPFGGGPRHCVGKHLAMLEAQSILATVIGEYDLEYVGETPLELQPSLTAHPKDGMEMRVERP